MLILVSSANSQISPMHTQHRLSSQLLIGTQSTFALHTLFLTPFYFLCPTEASSGISRAMRFPS